MASNKTTLGMILGVGIAGAAFTTGVLFHKIVINNIPPENRENMFDILDYLTGTNLFNRRDSKM